MVLGVPRENEALVIDGGAPQSIPEVEKYKRGRERREEMRKFCYC